MSAEDFDGFGDVINGSYGIFGDELKQVNDARAATEKEGVCFEFLCQGCGRPTQIHASWPEIISLKYGVDPAQSMGTETRWFFVKEEHAWTPGMRCPYCQFALSLRVKPHEPDGYLKDGKQRGFLAMETEAQLTQRAAAMAQRMIGRR